MSSTQNQAGDCFVRVKEGPIHSVRRALFVTADFCLVKESDRRLEGRLPAGIAILAIYIHGRRSLVKTGCTAALQVMVSSFQRISWPDTDPKIE